MCAHTVSRTAGSPTGTLVDESQDRLGRHFRLAQDCILRRDHLREIQRVVHRFSELACLVTVGPT